jgi:hypothetical protein
MHQPSRPILDLETFVLLLFAAVVGGLATALMYMSTSHVPQSLMTGGAAAGAALLWARSVIKPPKGS